MRHITLRQIEGFIAAAETLSFARAAETMHVTAPAFSQLIAEIEAGLGVRLFDRTTRRVVITAAGASLLRKLKRGVLEIDAACDEARAIARMECGHLAVSTLPSLAVGVVTQALGEMHERFPAVTISLYEGYNGSLFDRLVQGEDDFTICAYSDAARDLTFTDLFTEELVAVVPVGHRLAHNPALTWKDMGQEALILTLRHSSIREEVMAAFGHNGIVKNIEYETANMFTALSMVRAGLGITIVPFTVLPYANMSGLAWRGLHRPTPARRIAVCLRADRTASPAARQFEAVLRECIARDAPRDRHAAGSGAPGR